MEIGQAFEKLFIYAGSHAQFTPNTRSIGLYYNDPKSTDINKLRSTACITIDKALSDKEAHTPYALFIPAEKCATVLFNGSYAEL